MCYQAIRERLRQVLQLDRSGSKLRLTTDGLEIRYTRKAVNTNFQCPIVWPLEAQSFTVILETFPNFFTNPATQSPWLFQITPPPLAFFGSPNTKPSEFSFTHPGWVLLHLTWTWILFGLLGMFGTIAKNSALFLIQRALNPLSTFLS